MVFTYKSESEEFGKALLDMAVETHRDQISAYISKENVHSFKHGRNWLTIREQETEESTFKEKGVELKIEYEDLLVNNTSQLFQVLSKFIEGFTSQIVQGMYQTISESCDKVGNTVKQSEYSSQAEAFLELLKKVEFSVNENGQVELPQLHVGPDAAKPLIASLESQGEEFKNEVNRIQKEKTEAALDKEKQRLNKFAGVDL